MWKNDLSPALWLLAGMLLIGQPVLADRQSLTSITLQAEAFIAAYPYASPYPAEVTLSRLDSRLNLRACANALGVEFTHRNRTMGNTSLTVRCDSPVQWQLHLPAKITVYDDVIVNARPLVKGQQIDAAALKKQKVDITHQNQGFFRDVTALQELQAKRNLPAGSVLNSTNLASRQLVKSGQRVTILLNIQGLRIRTDGQALQSAARGQVIRVKNIRSNRIVEGVVTAPGQITVTL